MNDPHTNNAETGPTDEEIAALLAPKARKGSAKDPSAPSPRLPEAAYYYIFILIEALLLMGVWGFMRQGAEAALGGPGLEDPDVGKWLAFNFKSMFQGIGALLTSMPWVPALVLLVASAVFVPRAQRQRKRAATLISTLVVGVFVVLIAMQFSQDMAQLTRT